VGVPYSVTLQATGGTTPYTFKTVFGTVRVRRRRIEHKADGTTEIPSAHAWQTPRQVAITPGLRNAACDGMLRDSAQQTVAGEGDGEDQRDSRQAALSERLDILSAELTTLQEVYLQKVAALNQLKQSLLHRAFSGELSEREPIAA